MLSIIDFYDFEVRINELWKNKWFLLTSGDFKSSFNTMTVAWGSFGIMWNKPFVQVVVRPTRYTYEFMEEYDDFTLCSFPEKYKSDLKMLGTKSGRDTNKIEISRLTPVESKKINSPSFSEADLILECKKIYFQDMNPKNFLDPSIENNYPRKDYHRIYFGEILLIMSF